MKVLTAQQMRRVDRLTVEAGIANLILMENAAHRVVEAMLAHFPPGDLSRIVVLCGKGNNGGDGLAIARLLHVRRLCQELHVVVGADPEELSGEPAQNLQMLEACGVEWSREVNDRMRHATLVVDAILGTGITGPARGIAADLIHQINHSFPFAKVCAVDIPSGMPSDEANSDGEAARADVTVTFTAPKPAHVLPPNCDRIGTLVVAQIGSRPDLYEEDPENWLNVSQSGDFHDLLAPRPRDGHKGTFGHALIIGGSRGKTGAIAMTGFAALKAGAGLATVACPLSAQPLIAAYAAEAMTEALPETADGAFSRETLERLRDLVTSKTVAAIGPGMGGSAETVEVIRQFVWTADLPLVIDADGLNALAPMPSADPPPNLRILTPHPGEMARLIDQTNSPGELTNNRLSIARDFAQTRHVVLILKGQRTLIASPDGQVWVNPTGTPALATGGSGDILTGIIAGLLAQFPEKASLAIRLAVFAHGLAGELAAATLGEQSVTATALFDYLPQAFQACRNHSAHGLFRQAVRQ